MKSYIWDKYFILLFESQLLNLHKSILYVIYSDLPQSISSCYMSKFLLFLAFPESLSFLLTLFSNFSMVICH